MIITVTSIGNTLDPLSTPARVSPRPDRRATRANHRDR
jgi:hypothetical protein